MNITYCAICDKKLNLDDINEVSMNYIPDLGYVCDTCSIKPELANLQEAFEKWILND